jgi:hypothetical protein
LNIGELFVQLGVKADTFTVKDFSRAIGNLPLSIASALTALTGMNLGFIALTSHTLDMANNLSLFRSETGLSTDTLQRWQQTAAKVGVSGDAVTNSILGISNAIVQITRFGAAGPAIAFGRLGISDWATKDPFQLLTELRSRYKTMDPNEFRAYAQQIGVGPELTRVFDMSPGKFNASMSSGPAMSNRDLQTMADFQVALAAFTLEVQKDFVPVLIQLTPVMADLAKALGWVIQNFGGFAVSEIQGAKVMVNDPKQYAQNLGTVFGFLVDEMKRVNPNALTVAITQHLVGTGNSAEDHRKGAEHLTRELTRAVKHMSTEN